MVLQSVAPVQTARSWFQVRVSLSQSPDFSRAGDSLREKCWKYTTSPAHYSSVDEIFLSQTHLCCLILYIKSKCDHSKARLSEDFTLTVQLNPSSTGATNCRVLSQKAVEYVCEIPVVARRGRPDGKIFSKWRRVNVEQGKGRPHHHNVFYMSD